MEVKVRFSVATPFAPSNAPGAIAVIQLRSLDGASMDGALDRLGVPGMVPGRMSVRSVLGVDECVVVRWGERCLHVMPHAGKAVMQAMIQALRSVGVEPEETDDPRAIYPETGSVIDACLMDAMSRAASLRAVDVIATHAERWRAGQGAIWPDDAPEARALGRLITPPMVIGWGAANVGKSSLLNALAGRAVSIVADEPGTTRDHVGVWLDLDGITVRWIDAPGVGHSGGPEDRAAMEMVASLARGADLVVLMGDAASGIPAPPDGYCGPVIRCATRSDLSPRSTQPGSVLSTSVLTGHGVAELAREVRRALVSDRVLAAAGRWRFHPCLEAAI